jgi:methylphosphotriester-DNA--protein-cysteine methyltransferase
VQLARPRYRSLHAHLAHSRIDMMSQRRLEPEGSADIRWQAVLSRDVAADGKFVFGVTTTGIYCRPTCPARRPRRDHVRFFDSPQAAEQAGMRACFRCKPARIARGAAAG